MTSNSGAERGGTPWLGVLPYSFDCPGLQRSSREQSKAPERGSSPAESVLVEGGASLAHGWTSIRMTSGGNSTGCRTVTATHKDPPSRPPLPTPTAGIRYQDNRIGRPAMRTTKAPRVSEAHMTSPTNLTNCQQCVHS